MDSDGENSSARFHFMQHNGTYFSMSGLLKAFEKISRQQCSITDWTSVISFGTFKLRSPRVALEKLASDSETYKKISESVLFSLS